ncbi:MAG: PIN domain-containing protein [Rubrivivax sp.]|nr:PIN domain-containing protein [Rubrivivax sp.]
MLAAIDTNVLGYAEGAGDERRKGLARALLVRLPDDRVILPVQVLGELYRILAGRYRLPASLAQEAVLRWADTFAVRGSTWTAMQSAMDLTGAHGLSIWDSLIVAVAAEQRCRVLLSEDLQAGFTWQGVTIVDPFAEPAHPLLDELLA